MSKEVAKVDGKESANVDRKRERHGMSSVWHGFVSVRHGITSALNFIMARNHWSQQRLMAKSD